ncbi:MAG: hypothetical protein JWN44_1800, partial [Myxococcales bacterium]|nr:hypothetical protein [Myxococcales bacterium]
LASQAAMALQNARMHAESLKQQPRLDTTRGAMPTTLDLR